MAQMTFDELCILYDKVDEMEFSMDTWYPKQKDIDEYIAKNPDKYLKFLIWITENPPAYMPSEAKEIEKQLKQIIKKTVVVTEGKEEE